MSAGTSGHSPSGPETSGPASSPDATGPDSSGGAGETSGPIISDERDAAAARPLPSHRH